MAARYPALAAPGPGVAACGSEELVQGCSHVLYHPPYLLSFLLAAAAVLAIALFCCAVLAMMKMEARSPLDQDENGSAAAPGQQLPPNSNPDRSSERVVTLVLFPGEEEPHTLAVPVT
ncbi:hypothetical protein GOP47_0003200 [Adiantum capillus-veneris]|uniref:Uncharacterized protein n=1 Tax=Adiantum capillus-veneris TaxID=13818 RepID=A0A9D4VDI2_ADICA|nr:hypothetical protein GOP47_0003200 [Adiantum capillus-veneris]